MSFFQQLQQQTAAERETLFAAPIIQQALAGEVALPSYIAFLTEAYHHVSHTVPLLMACGARLPVRLEWLRGAIAEYIDEEYGHQEWILNDLAACGADPAAVRRSQPALPTELMVAYVYDRIARAMMMFGEIPMERSAATECCVGLVLISPVAPMVGSQVTCTKRQFSRPTSLRS